MGSPTEISDPELVAAMARGDNDALGALYDRHCPVLLAIAVRILGDPREAEDLVHDVLLEAWNKADDYDRARGSVRTWLSIRLRSRALDRWRRANRIRDLMTEAHNLGAALPGAAEEPGQALDHARLRAAVHDLPAL